MATTKGITMSLLANLTVSYRPIVGFADDCTVCGGKVARYGRTVTAMPGEPQRGMPQALIDAHTWCHGHAIRVPQS